MAAELTSPQRWLHVFGSFENGGAEVRTVQLIEALGADFEHVLVSLDGSRAAAAARPLPRTAFVGAPSGTAGSSLRSVRFVRRVAAEHRADALLTYGWGAFDAVLAARCGIIGLPCVHHEDGFTREDLERPRRRRDVARRLCLGAIRGTVVPSSTLRDHAMERWGVPASRVHHLPNGIPEHGTHPGAEGLRARLGVGADTPLAVVLGRLARVKRVELAIAACARAGIELVVIGDGPERGALEAAAQAAGGRCHFLGDVPTPRDLLPEADVYLSSSLSEQHPLAMLEAMDAGLAVVATAVGDVEVTLPPAQRQWLLPATASADDMAGVLTHLAGDAALRSRLGEANRGRIRASYRTKNTARRYGETVGALLAPRRPRPTD